MFGDPTTVSDKTTVLQWTFVALSNHPELKQFSHVTEAQKNALDQSISMSIAAYFEVDQCSTQTKAVIQADGVQAVGESFQQLGQITGEEI